MNQETLATTQESPSIQASSIPSSSINDSPIPSSLAESLIITPAQAAVIADLQAKLTEFATLKKEIAFLEFQSVAISAMLSNKKDDIKELEESVKDSRRQLEISLLSIDVSRDSLPKMTLPEFYNKYCKSTLEKAINESN